MKTVALLLSFAALLGAQQAGIEGVALNQTTGEPVQGVHVRLYSGIGIEGATIAYGAVSDRQGRFSVAAMPPGNYVVDAGRTGFYSIPGDGFMGRTEVALRPGQTLSQYRIQMLPLIPVSGR